MNNFLDSYILFDDGKRIMFHLFAYNQNKRPVSAGRT
jgi:hypothetical protein